MDNRIKTALDSVSAEESLKRSTRAYLIEKTGSYGQSRRPSHIKGLVIALACFVFLVSGGAGMLYFTPVSAISVDADTSVELGINRFNRVVSVKSFDEEGDALLRSLNVKYMDYLNALTTILESAPADNAKNDELISVTVSGDSDEREDEMTSQITACMEDGYRATYCCAADGDEVEAAHEAGLSFGKYKAFLALKALEPDITVEAVAGLTMHELHALTEKARNGESIGEALCGDGESNSSNSEDCNSTGGGHGYGSGDGTGANKGGVKGHHSKDMQSGCVAAD